MRADQEDEATLDQRIHLPEWLADLCTESGNLDAAVQALGLIGKARGYHGPDSNVTDSDLMKVFHELAKTAPSIAAQFAKDHGIPWSDQTAPTAH
jgi:hypothetical protein